MVRSYEMGSLHIYSLRLDFVCSNFDSEAVHRAYFYNIAVCDTSPREKWVLRKNSPFY